MGVSTKLLSPLHIPQGRCGDWEIVHNKCPPGTEFYTANLRCQLFGQRNQKVSWPMETTWTYLKEGGAVWMSDLPCEHAQTLSGLKGIRGRVLVGGLGLGLAATVLNKKMSIRQITVVEKSQEVIDLVWKHVWNGFRNMVVVHSDLFDYLKEYDGPPFNNAFFDIWQSDGEITFFETVCPLYDLTKGKVNNPPRNWNEDIMRGQLYHSLIGRLLSMKGSFPRPTESKAPWEEIGIIWHDWQVPFWRWWKKKKPDEVQTNMVMSTYTRIYGTWDWQNTWKEVTHEPRTPRRSSRT